MSESRIDLSVIIVSFNTKDLLRNCLESVYASKFGNYSFDVYVYDNASTDGSPEMVKSLFPHARVIVGKENSGFAAANNVCLRKARGKYILLLNSDTEVEDETLAGMIAFMDSHKDAGAATCRLVLPDGKLDPACHRGFPTPWAAFTYFLRLEKLFSKSELFGQYHQGYKDFHTPHKIDSPSGAFFLIRREVIEKVGMLDEDYFMYAEDLDWAYRMHEKGITILYNPSISCLHVKKQSGRLHANRKVRIQAQIQFHENNRLFYRKHFEKKYGRLVSFVILSFYSVRLFFLKHFSL